MKRRDFLINQGKLTQENKAAAIEALTRMTAYAKTRKVMVGAEPQGDPYENVQKVYDIVVANI
jgi:hypothetical protein